MLLRKSGILIPKDHPEASAIIKHLDRFLYDWDGSAVPIKFFEDMGDHYLIPRFYPVKDYVVDQTDPGEDIDIESNIIPRTERQALAMDWLPKQQTGVLRLEPGSGKTVVAIHTISTLKKRAIVFAHKTKLLGNWVSEILKFTNLTEDDIAKLSTKNFKKALKKKIIICTPHVIAYAVNHNNHEFLEALRNSRIGIAFIDECHVGVGPEEFSKSSLNLCCRNLYGLSATPTRKDGNDDIINFHLGEVKYFPPEEGELIDPKVYMIYFPFGIYGQYKKYLTWGGRFQGSRYLKQMFKVEKYIKTVSALIKRSYNEGRITLVLGDRVASLLELAKKAELPKEDVGIFIPGSTKKERLSVSDTDDLDDAFFKKKVVFSTYLACRDGNNRKDLDCLIMSTPTGNPEQAIGRIQRELEGKKTPIVLDIVDTEGPEVNSIHSKTKINWFMRSAEKRIELYKEFKWNIETINLK